jgi:hypothetical protein
MDDMIRKLPLEVQSTIQAVADQERQDREANVQRGLQSASEAMADTSRTLPFSMRLTGSERERLARAAAEHGMTKTELARQLIADGLSRMESRQDVKVDAEQASQVVGEIIDLLDRTGIVERFRMRHTGS